MCMSMNISFSGAELRVAAGGRENKQKTQDGQNDNELLLIFKRPCTVYSVLIIKIKKL